METELRNTSFRDIKNETLSLDDRIILFLYAIYIILKPFYFWSSGLPQISDLTIILLINLIIFLKRNYLFNIGNKYLFIFATMFTFYSVGINLVWSIIYSTSEMIFPGIYILYNFCILITISLMIQLYKNITFKVTFYSSLLSVLIQLIISIALEGVTGTRNIGTFNNPNQLGYYALLMGSLMIISFPHVKRKLIWVLSGLIFSFILVLTSLSKAAILSYIALLVVYIINRLLDKKYTKKTILVLLLITGLFTLVDLTTDFFQENKLLDSVETRINSIGEDSDDNLEGRGYDRILNYPEYWILGAGEGEYNRFSGFLQGGEVHSTLGNIQVSYGIVGLTLFLFLINYTLNVNHYKDFYLIFVILIYGLTHNGLRNSLFWILIALIGTVNWKENNVNRNIE